MTIAERVQKLEQTNRRWRFLSLGLALTMGTAIMMGQMQGADDDELTAKRFNVQDKDGQTRAALLVTEMGTPALRFFDPLGTMRATLAVTAQGASALAFYDQSGKARATLEMKPGGETALVFRDKFEKDRAKLVVRADGSPGLNLYDMQRRSLFRAPVPPETE